MSGSHHENADVNDSDESEEEKHEKTETLPRIPEDARVKQRLLQLLKELEHMIEWEVPDSLIHKKK